MDWRRGACGRWTLVLLSGMGLGKGLAPIGSPGWSPDEFLLSPFYEQIVRSQCKGWGDISLILPRLSSRAQPVGTLESIQEE